MKEIPPSCAEYGEYICSKIFGDQKVKLYKIKHFIFDFGGVMVERTFVLRNLFEILNTDLGITIPDHHESTFINKLRRGVSSGRISSREFLEKIFERFYHPQNTKNSSLPVKKPNVEYYLELWFNLYSEVTDLSADMAEIVHQLRNAGFNINLMSNVYDIYAKSNELRGFYDMFDNKFLSSDIGLRKPNVEKFKYVLSKLNAKPKEIIFVDDKLENLVTAKELGFIVVKFENIQKFRAQLEDLGIEDIPPDLKKQIQEKYRNYRQIRKDYKKAKKSYKKAKKQFLSNQGRLITKKKEYEEKRIKYLKQKFKYNEIKHQKKEFRTLYSSN